MGAAPSDRHQNRVRGTSKCESREKEKTRRLSIGGSWIAG